VDLATLTTLYQDTRETISVYTGRDPDWADLATRIKELGVEWTPTDESASAAAAALGPDDAGLAIFLTPDGSIRAFGLPQPPVEATVRHGRLPYAAPLLEIVELEVAHVVVVPEGDSAFVAGFPAHGEATQERVTTGGDPAGQPVIEAVRSAVTRTTAELVLVVGTTAERSALEDRLAASLPSDCRVLPIEPSAEEDLADTVVRYVSDHTARRTVDALHRFRFAATHGAATEGVAATLDALRHGRVRLLLVHDDPADERTAWIGSGATHIAEDPDQLVELQGGGVSVRLIDGAIRSALLQGAVVHSIPGHLGDGPEAGIGATLGP
jgi:Bacterial archaeo-eukaryotic release factor family 2